MAIPDYQSLMLPVLEAGAGGEVSVRDCIQRLAQEFGLTEEEQQELLPSGKQTRFANRVHWARTYLVQAGLLEATRRGHFRISDRGRQVLQEGPASIDNEFLLKFEEFRDFRARRTIKRDGAEPDVGSTERDTPEELIDVAYDEIMGELRSELLNRIMRSTPEFFEKVVVDLMIAMGYGGQRENAGQRVGRSGDGGIDGIINEDPLGLDIIYLQAKRYASDNVIGVEKVREFAGSLVERGASKGVFVTTSLFTAGARDYAERIPQRLILIDGKELTRLLVRYRVAVRPDRTIELYKVDLEYFDYVE